MAQPLLFTHMKQEKDESELPQKEVFVRGRGWLRGSEREYQKSI